MFVSEFAIVVVHECNTDARRNHHHRTEQTGREHHGVFTRAHQPENQHETKRHRTQAHQMLAQSDTQQQIPQYGNHYQHNVGDHEHGTLVARRHPFHCCEHGEGDEQAEHRILRAEIERLARSGEIVRHFGD